jgi:[ribosomal protein S18]-alanine N-acetyltransferase
MEEIVGYLFYRFIADEVHIFRMAVSPEWRRQGIGSRLVAECLEKAFGRGVASALLEVRPSNSQAVELYRKFGFYMIATRPGYYSDSGEDAHILKLDMKEEHL